MEDLIYTCPMHPEIESKKPGSCPICGMDLELKTLKQKQKSSPEMDAMKKKVIAGALLCAALLVFSMTPIGQKISFSTNGILQFILTTPIVFWCGGFLFKRGWDFSHIRSLNMFSLISLGVMAAYLYSAFVLVRSFFIVPVIENARVDLYFETAGVIVVLVVLGQYLELKARAKTSQAIYELLELSPKTARKVHLDKSEEDIALDRVVVGDILRVRAGEKVPVDGIIVEGESYIDESMITGEPFPVHKGPQDKVIGATLLGDGSFLMKALRVGKDTWLAQLVDMVAAAQRSRAPMQKLADRVASYFVPVVVIISFLTLLVWGIWGASWTFGLINAVAVLIIACPCALGLATPVSIMVGIGKGAKEGILIKDAEALETLSKAQMIIVDKTGTLTEGRPDLLEVKSLSNKSEEEILQIAATLETASQHPIAKAILRGAKEHKIAPLAMKEFVTIRGKGIQGQIEGNKYNLGNARWLSEMGVDLSKAEGTAKGATPLYLVKDSILIGQLFVADRIKESSFAAIAMLHQDHVRVVMATGDHHETASEVGKTLGVDKVEAEVLPEDKFGIVKKFQQEGYIVAMAGDGINDAPALSQADIGIAMGTGSDVAIESAGVTLAKGDLRSLSKARRLSHLTVRNIKQNLWFAFLYNSLGIPIAAGVLYPYFGLMLSPVIASAAMTLSSLSVIVNALRLRHLKLS